MGVFFLQIRTSDKPLFSTEGDMYKNCRVQTLSNDWYFLSGWHRLWDRARGPGRELVEIDGILRIGAEVPSEPGYKSTVIVVENGMYLAGSDVSLHSGRGEGVRLRAILGVGENFRGTTILELTNDLGFEFPPTLYKHSLCPHPTHVNELCIAGRSFSPFSIETLLMGSILFFNTISLIKTCGVEIAWSDILL